MAPNRPKKKGAVTTERVTVSMRKETKVEMSHGMKLIEEGFKDGRRLSVSEFVEACVNHCLDTPSSFAKVETDLGA